VAGNQSPPGTSARGRVRAARSPALDVELDYWPRRREISARIFGIVAGHEAYRDSGRKPSDHDVGGRKTRRSAPDVRDTGMRVRVLDVFGLFAGRQSVRAACRQTVVQLTDSKRRRPFR